jgi:hypothetical protein
MVGKVRGALSTSGRVPKNAAAKQKGSRNMRHYHDDLCAVSRKRQVATFWLLVVVLMVNVLTMLGQSQLRSRIKQLEQRYESTQGEPGTVG